MARFPLISYRIYPHEPVRPLAQCRQTTSDQSLSGARLLALIRTRAQLLFPLSTDDDVRALLRRRAVGSPKDSPQDRQTTAVCALWSFPSKRDLPSHRTWLGCPSSRGVRGRELRSLEMPPRPARS